MLSPPKYCIKTNSLKPNLNLSLICCKEQILFGLMRYYSKNIDYHIKDNNKRLIDFIYGNYCHEKIKDFDSELILNSKTKDSFNFEKNFKEHKEELCKFYKINSKLTDKQIKDTILEQINLSFLK